MIELGCSGCSAFQDAPAIPANAYQHQQKQLHPAQQQSSGQLQSSATANPSQISSSTLSTATTSTPINFQQQQQQHQAKLNYFHHQHANHLLPQHLLAPPSHLLLGSNSATTSTGPNGSSATSFGLMPDARACVTATYLCVLIVNNTWLNCNLLDTLCNNNSNFNSNGNNNGSTHSPSSNDDDDDDEKRVGFGTPEDYVQLGALESALNELIAFAGGGNAGSEGERDVESESGWTKPPGEIRMAPVRFRLEPNKSNQPFRLPIELPDKGGGGGGGRGFSATLPQLYNENDILSQLLLYGQTLSKEDLMRLKLAPDESLRLQHQLADLTKTNRMSADENKSRLLEHYQGIRSSQAKKQVAQQQLTGSSNNNNSKELPQVQLNGTQVNRVPAVGLAPDQQSQLQPTQTQITISPLSPASSLVSWVGRPFRGWSAYSFWPAEATASSAAASSTAKTQLPPSPQDGEFGQQEHSLKHVQILRPVDRTDQYNDIATNQSSLKPILSSVQQQQQQFIMPQRQYQLMEKQQQAGDKSTQTFQSNESPAAVLATTQGGPSIVLGGGGSSNNKQQQLQQFGSATDVRQAQAPPPPPVVAHTGAYGELISSTTVANSEQFSGEVGANECKCNQVSSASELVQVPDDRIQAECHYRCQLSSAVAIAAVAVAQSQQQQQQQSPQSTTPSLIDSTQPLVTSSTITTSTTTTSTTTSSSGKMNPLDVTFILYTRYHRDLASGLAQMSGATAGDLATAAANSLGNAGELIDLTNETMLNESRLNSSLPIKIVIHGFGSGGRRPWVTDMVYKLLDYEDVNVVVVDWEKGAVLPNYVQAAGNTRLVGHKIACLIKSINAKYGLTGNSYHLIGFSLGAHVAGFAGMEIRNSTSAPRHWINRITGLDPASPLFEGYEPNDRLDPSDAQFVDVIHSNGDGVLRGGFGSLQPMGHVDFYPNGGRVQVGCNSVLLSALSDIIYGKWQSLCNHRRALNFFMDSFEFNKCRFHSFNCDSYENYLKGDCFDCGFNNEKCSYMGYLANYSKGRGKMYLTTHEEAPFCANQFIIKIIGAKGYKTHWGKVEVTLVTSDGKNESFWLSSINQQSTNELGSNQKELGQHSMQSLIVAQPTLVNFTQILLRYTKYKGWIYSGDESWPIEKVFITDSDGQVKSFCGFNTVLESYITTRLNLEPGNCTIAE